MDFLTERANLQGKVAVVTGGAGGLGLPITRDLLKAGVKVAYCDRDAAAIEACRAEVDGLGESLAVHADVRDPEAMEAFFAAVDERFGRLDVLVDVPGGGFVAPLMNTREKGWNAIIKQNFTYVLDTTQHAVRRMEAQGTGGSIIYVSSVEAHRAVPYRAVYGAMKAGLVSLAKSLALELGLAGIRINTVAPDIFPTPATGGYDAEYEASPEGRVRRQAIIPMGRTGTGEDLSGCVLFLASDLSSYVNGTTVHVDGGTLAAAGWFGFPAGLLDDDMNRIGPDPQWGNNVPRSMLRGLPLD
ncbi:MAG: SDR family NAD(P)-dependent oxidoreductase [Acidimicrobiia bacterium]